MKTVNRPAVVLSVSLLVAATAFADEPAGKTPPDREREELLKRLRDDNPDTISEALFDLEYDSPQRKLSVKQRLIELMNSPHQNLRGAAIRLLADLGPDAADAMPELQKQLADMSPGIRLAAAEAVWQVGGRADLAAPVFIEVLTQDANFEGEFRDRWLRRSATSGLQRMGPAVSLKSLMKLMDDPRDFVRYEAALILGALGPQHREQVEERLVAALDDPAGKVRLAAARGLDEIDAPLEEALQVLIEMAQQEIPPSDQTEKAMTSATFLASSAVEAIGDLEGDAAPAVGVLSELLKSHVLVIRLEAATALGRIGPAAKDAIPALSAALQETEVHSMPFAHRSWCLGENAAIALGRIGVEAVPVLLEALEDKDVMIRARAAKALGGVAAAAQQSIGPLSRRLDDPHPFVRIEAAIALGELGPVAVETAPRLARLLLNERSVTSFRGRVGLGHDESTAEEAWRALRNVKPSAEQVMPALVEALKNTDGISYEAICALRRFSAEAASAKEPLERLLKQEKTRVAAACALAFVAPDHEEIQPILQEAVFAGEEPGMYPPLGLGQLAAAGRTFDPDFRSRLMTLAEKQYDVLLWHCVFRMMPDDEQVTESFVEAIQHAHSLFDAVGLRESEKTVVELIGSHPRLKQAVLRELEFVAERAKEEDDYVLRILRQTHRRVWAARMLITARIEVEQALACLSQLIGDNEEDNDIFTCADVADTLSDDPSPPREAIPLLTRLLDVNETYFVSGDFYGNGGESRVVGDRAALALVNLKATEALLGKLDSEDAEVRARGVRALGQMGDRSVINDLLLLAADPYHQVREATIVALGRIGQAHPDVRGQLEGTLKTALSDRRRAVRDAAAEALAAWGVDE